MEIIIKPIGIVQNNRKEIKDDNWGCVISKIILNDEYSEEALSGIEDFSHVEVLYYFDKVLEEKIEHVARHPRNNSEWPKVGIFAQRGKNRPNRIGITIAKIVNRIGVELTVQGLDAIDGTPVIDIKPVMIEYLPQDKVSQPRWATEIMQNYW
jgi:tRNA-Thr(GGU) m(6)t(6)A37 methyltransferase TsaA